MEIAAIVNKTALPQQVDNWESATSQHQQQQQKQNCRYAAASIINYASVATTTTMDALHKPQAKEKINL